MISVIVPVYNAEENICECLESLRVQTYQDFEIILIDDGSRDQSAVICSEYAKNDKRIRFVQKRNGGVASARNIGISMARGRYIAFVDSDDIVECDYLEELYRRMPAEGDDSLVICRFSRFSKEQSATITVERLLSYCKGVDSIYQTYLYDLFITKNIFGSCCRVLFPKYLIDQYNIKFPKCKIAEDQLFLISALVRCSSIYVVDKSLYLYRMNDKSATNEKYKENYLDDRITYLNELMDRLSLFDLSEKEKNVIVGHVIMNYRNRLFFNAAFSSDYKEEYKKIMKSRFCNTYIPRGEVKSWRKSLSKNDKILDLLIRMRLFSFLRFIRKIRIRL